MPLDDKDRIARLEARLAKRERELDACRRENRSLAAKKGLSVDMYRKLLKAIHPDRRPSEAEKNETFHLLIKHLRDQGLVFDDLSPPPALQPQVPPLPSTPEEWAAAKRRATAERKARRAARKSPPPQPKQVED